MINWSVRRSGKTLLTRFHDSIKQSQAHALSWAEVVSESAPQFREVSWASATPQAGGETCVRYTCVQRGGGDHVEVQRKRGVVPGDVRAAIAEAIRHVHEWTPTPSQEDGS